jgi:hypothetical protein
MKRVLCLALIVPVLFAAGCSKGSDGSSKAKPLPKPPSKVTAEFFKAAFAHDYEGACKLASEDKRGVKITDLGKPGEVRLMGHTAPDCLGALKAFVKDAEADGMSADSVKFKVTGKQVGSGGANIFFELGSGENRQENIMVLVEQADGSWKVYGTAA